MSIKLTTFYSRVNNDGSGGTIGDASAYATGATGDAYEQAVVLQTGYITATDDGTHTFNLGTDAGGFLAIDGEVLVNAAANGTYSANINLELGKTYSFVLKYPAGTVNAKANLTYSSNATLGANVKIQDSQFSVPSDLASNPFVNVKNNLDVLNFSHTPDFVNPPANVVPTNILANSIIATVPVPAITPSIANVFSGDQMSRLKVPQYNDTVDSDDRPRGRMPLIVDAAREPDDKTRPSQNTIGSSVRESNTVGPSYKNMSEIKTAGYHVPEGTKHTIRAQTIGMEAIGLIPNTRLSVFFDGVNVTKLCAPGEVSSETGSTNEKEPDVDWELAGKKGDPIVTSANGMAVAVFYVPEKTFTIGTKNIAFFNYTSDTDTYEGKYANNTCSAFATFSAANHDGKDQDDIVVFATAPDDVEPSGNNTSDRTGGDRDGHNVYYPMCQSFYVGSDMSEGQDGIYLSSVDLYFSTKSNNHPVSVQLRTMKNDAPTNKKIPYSTVTLPSSMVNIAGSSTSNNLTKFSFSRPVFLKAGYSYALAVQAGGNNPDYTVWTATTGTVTANGTVNANWGQGKLYKATSKGKNWTAVPNQFLKFGINRTEHDSGFIANGVAVITNADYEFLSIINPSQIPFQVGEYVYQQPTAHVAICSTDSTSNVLSVNTTHHAKLQHINDKPLKDFKVGDHVVVCGSFPSTDRPEDGGHGRFNHNLFGNARSLKVTSVDANGLFLTFSHANGAAATGPWTNGAHYIYKAQPGILSYDPEDANTSARKVITGIGTKFNDHHNTNEKDRTDKRPVIVHSANNTHGHHEVLWPKEISSNTSIKLKHPPKKRRPVGANVQAIPIYAPAGKVVDVDYARNLVILEKSTANNETGANSAANVYSTPSFFAPGRTLVGTESGATAILAGVHDMPLDSMQPIVHTSTPQGTTITYTANLTTNVYTTISVSNYNPDVTNYFTNNQIIIASRTNEVTKMANNKSFVLTATLTSNSTLLSPTIDLLGGATILVKTNEISSLADGEYTNNGKALSKSVSKIVTLSDGNDAEDLTVFLTAYKPLGTNLTVYAKLLAAEDTEKFEDKNWSVLRQVGGVGLYSDTNNQNDYKEYQYTLPTNPIAVPSFELITSNNSTTIVSTNSDTEWQSKFSNNQLITMYSDIYGSDFEVNQIANVVSNTEITLLNPVGLANTSSAIIASMPYPHAAFKNSNNGNIVRYYTADGSAHDSFKKFAIKIVFTAERTNLVPKVTDMRVLALSV